MAVSLSTNAVKLYSPVTGQYYGECRGHSTTINHISFSGASTPHVLHSCSSDGTIRAWDSRSFQEVSCISAGNSQEVFSFSFGGSNDNLLAAGCQSQILFWDWRNKKQVACLEDSHVDDVTQVHFAPDHRSKLVSASVDGLICIFDTEGDINDDEHLESVINVGTSVGKVGFLGGKQQKLWCLTHIETLSVWDWKGAKNEASFQDARLLASNSWALDHVSLSC
ncbi:WD repeat-containing protein GTS1-like isoform X2 [Juglans regia]|nr:WD repeat-containing protein GTS1-like isoform X2 [Juglans regia]